MTNFVMEKIPKLWNTARALAVVFSCWPALSAQQTIVVDAAGGGDFTEIQPAVDAAPVGGLVRVRYGEYPGDVVINKGIRLVGDRPDEVSSAVIHGSIQVLDIPAHQSFVAANFLLQVNKSDQGVFNIENCQGNVHLATSRARLRIRNCNYVTVDLVRGEANLEEPSLFVENSFVISSYSAWFSLHGVQRPVDAIRSKLILVGSELTSFNWPFFEPTGTAIKLTDSELIYTGDVKFNVGCDPSMVHPCPPEMTLIGSSTVEKEDSGAGAVGVDGRDINQLRIRYGAANSLVTAVLVGFPIRPVHLHEGILYLDLLTSVLLHVGPPPPPFGTVRVNLPALPGNLFGIPVTFQGAGLANTGEVGLSIPLTIVF